MNTRRTIAACRCAWGLLAVLLAVTPPSALANPSTGVGLSKISLPSGPGSIEGLGDSFDPQLNSGTSAYSVKIAVPPGVNGLQPEVVLRYNAGSGNGPFGLAWSYDPMSISRETQKGLPTYGSSDVFMFMGEELVALEDGSYRMKNESSFMRVMRSGDGWSVTEKSGKVHLLGITGQSRITKPGASSFTTTFKWFEEQVFDTHSNQMQFSYSTYPESTGQVYCTGIQYSLVNGNSQSVVFDFEPRLDTFSSFLSGFEVKTGRRCSEIRVLSNGGLVRRYQLGYEVNTNDVVEPISSNDSGLAFSLIRRVTQFDNRDTNVASYLPPLQFGYTRFDTSTGTMGTLSNRPPISLGNANMSIIDINCDSLPDLIYTDPLTGKHTVYYNQGNGFFSNGVAFVSYPNVTLGQGNVELADFDGDGKTDLILKTGTTSGLFGFYRNTASFSTNDNSHPAWGSFQSFPAPYPPFNLNDPSARTLDLNGDKRMDYMQTTLYGFTYFYNKTNGWQQDGIHLFGDAAMGDITAADNVQFSTSGSGGTQVANKYVKLADMNGDRLLDLVRLSVAGTRLQVTFWPNKGFGALGNRQVMTGTIDLGVIPVENVFVMDINGDGLSDIVAVGYNYINYWINQGNGSFSQQFQRTGTPNYQSGVTVLRQADINGNGSTDFIWENYDPVARAYVAQYYDFLGTTKPNLLNLIDNGIGLRTSIEYKTTTDYYVAASQNGTPWHTKLPYPSTVVSKITKSDGLDLDGVPGIDQYITEFSFYDGYYDDFMKEFRGFGFAKKIDRGDDQFLGAPNEIPVYSPSTITRYKFHTGALDGIDNNGDSVIDEFDPINGREEEPLKGKVLWSEVTLPTADFGGSYPAQVDGQYADDSVVFSRDLNNWLIKLIHTPTGGFVYQDAFGSTDPVLSLPYATTDGKRVQFAFMASHTNQMLEANGALAGSDAFTPLRPGKQTYVENDYDFFGNMVADRNYGENSPGSTYNDKRFTYNTYAFNLDSWIIGLPASHLVTDTNGVFVSGSQNYYDGADFTGLPLGQVGAYGDMVREVSLINGSNSVVAFSNITTQVGDPRLAANASITTVRNRYDSYGNLVETRDPLYSSAGQGHSKEYGYDPFFATFVTTETIHVGNGSPDLVAQASYDYGAGVMLSSTNFNGNATSYLYDSFWRLVGIVKPGDSTFFPTATFSYMPGDSFRRLYYNYDSAGNLSVLNTADASVVNSVATHQRTTAGQANTFDTMSFTDGMGRKLGTEEENDVPGQWVAKDFKLYSSKGAERRSFLPYVTASATYDTTPETSYNVASFYDSAGRVTGTVNPPETSDPSAPQTQTRTVYLPLETVLYDEEQTSPSSSRYLNCHYQFKDGLDRLIGVTEVTRLNDNGTSSASQASWLTSYEYDLNDNLTHITDSQSNQKWFRYDGLKRKLYMNDPDRGTMTYTYDDASNLRATVDAKFQTISYNYDGVNRLLAEFYRPTNQPPDVTYHYDAPYLNLALGDGTTATPNNTKGMLAYVQDFSGEEHTSYDARGRVEYVVKRIPDPLFQAATNLVLAQPLVSYRTGFAYDSLDRVSTLTYADNDQVTYLYNSRNLVSGITGGPSGYIISNILYQASAQLQEIDYGNGVRTTYGYDPRLRLNSLLTAAKPGNPTNQLINFFYAFDGVSNIKSILDNRPLAVVSAGDPRRNNQLFQYDDLYRITYAGYAFGGPGATNVDGGSINYQYDRIGNMLAQTSGMTNTDSVTGLPVANLGSMASGGIAGRSGRLGRQPNDPPGPHALSQITATNSTARNYFYDDNGNMSVIDGLTNTWDYKDRLVAVESSWMRAKYTYDYTDRRISKTVFNKTNGVATSTPSLTTLYPDKYFEVRENDAPTKYVWNGNTRVARVTGSLSSNQRVQRVRIWPGYNLISVAVGGASLPSNPKVSDAYLWNAATLTWQTVSSNTSLAAGSVLWVQATTNCVLTFSGNYSDPANSAVIAGPNFLPVPGLEALAGTNLKSSVSTNNWRYDSQNQIWQIAIPLTNFSSLPTSLAPGEALFVRADAATVLTAADPTLRVRYYHQDHLSSSSAISDDVEKLVEETYNYPFGYLRKKSVLSGISESYQFTQKERDVETFLSYFESRFLSTAQNHFIGVDPLADSISKSFLFEPQRFNPYSYCINRPLTRLDLDGRFDRALFLESVTTFSLSVVDAGIGTLEVSSGLLAIPGAFEITGSVATAGLGFAGIVSSFTVDSGSKDAQRLRKSFSESKETVQKLTSLNYHLEKAAEKGLQKLGMTKSTSELTVAGIKMLHGKYDAAKTLLTSEKKLEKVAASYKALKAEGEFIEKTVEQGKSSEQNEPKKSEPSQK